MAKPITVLARLLLLTLLLICILFGIVLLRTLLLQKLPPESDICSASEDDFIALDDAMIQRFQAALRLRTVSRAVHDYDRDQLALLDDHIINSFPVIHSSPLVKWQKVSNYSLLYVVSGANVHLLPYLLLAHLDVVPADDATKWAVPPFSAEIHGGFVYGRGAIDNKHSVFGILEALEFKLKRGWKPERTIYIAFGHDEEVLGFDGAREIGRVLLERGIKFEFIVDEGTCVLQDVIPHLKQPLALISTSEKGYMDIKMSVRAAVGHSSVPPSESSIGILAHAIARLEDNPHELMFGTGPEIAIFENIAPYMAFPVQVVLSNLWLFGPVVARLLSSDPAMNALMRTTTAVTMVSGGIKSNVLAPYAEAIVNHRIHPSQTASEVLERDRAVVNDERVKFEVLSSSEAHPVSYSGADSFGFQTIKKTVRQIWGSNDVVVSAGLLVGATDTKHYLELSPNVFRFSPTFMYPQDIRRFHGDNERLSVENYGQAINYFSHLMTNADRETLPAAGHEPHSADL